MRTLAGLSMAMVFAGALLAQHSGGRVGGGGFHGGGGGGGFHLGGGSGLVGGGRRAVTVPYAYPVYVGSGYYYTPDYATGYTDGSYGMAPPAQAPNVTVIYPPLPAPAMGSQFGPGPNPEPVSPYQPSAAQADDQSAPDHYLLALKDHTIYSVVAYWVDGDTLHYFTAGNVHNQASLSLVDRDLTARLNKGSGLEVKLPPAK